MSYVRIFSFIIGAVGLLIAVLPKIFFKFNKVFNRVIFTDAEFFSSPRISGVIFLIIGFILEFVAYRFRSIYPSIFVNFPYLPLLIVAFLLIGLVSIITGIIFLVKPAIFVKINEVGNTVIFSEKSVYSNPRFFGVILVIISIILFFV
ncbi:hypothetical protein DRQ09_09085 [candidate division KSB1 bacterium]|nr:MAG: hypothetical protein DRQ09_09085 [candidate division KSB1 bacterium]